MDESSITFGWFNNGLSTENQDILRIDLLDESSSAIVHCAFIFNIRRLFCALL